MGPQAVRCTLPWAQIGVKSILQLSILYIIQSGASSTKYGLSTLYWYKQNNVHAHALKLLYCRVILMHINPGVYAHVPNFYATPTDQCKYTQLINKH